MDVDVLIFGSPGPWSGLVWRVNVYLTLTTITCTCTYDQVFRGTRTVQSTCTRQRHYFPLRKFVRFTEPGIGIRIVKTMLGDLAVPT